MKIKFMQQPPKTQNCQDSIEFNSKSFLNCFALPYLMNLKKRPLAERAARKQAPVFGEKREPQQPKERDVERLFRKFGINPESIYRVAKKLGPYCADYTPLTISLFSVFKGRMKEKIIFDFGSGESGFPSFLCDHGAKAFGFDKNVLDKFSGFGGHVFSDMRNLGHIKTSVADAVVANKSTCFLGEAERRVFVESVFRMLKPGGYFIVQSAFEGSGIKKEWLERYGFEVLLRERYLPKNFPVLDDTAIFIARKPASAPESQ
jgi:SAM-dependent methyltransferase